MPLKTNSSLKDAFCPDNFRNDGHHLIDALADHLQASLKRPDKAVLPNLTAEDMLENWSGGFSQAGEQNFTTIIQKILDLSNNLQHPRYIGHQCCTPLPLAALNDLIGNYINNASAVYEMGPANIAMEKRLIEWMTRLIGWDENADGIFTNGGTIGNLTALLAARQVKADYDIWKKGIKPQEPLAILVSCQCHYSVKRAAGVMGLGEDAVYLVEVDENYHVTSSSLQDKFQKAEKDGRKVFAVVANACSTATGSYDDLNMIADFAAAHDLWFHVDSAHGASALISDKYRHLLTGLLRADSLVWDAHKMMMIPALATAVIFKNGSNSYATFSQKASYLFEGEATDEWYNYAHRTMECTKTMMGIKIYVPLMVLGTNIFRDFIDYTYDLARTFAEVIEQAPDFETAHRPESNIVCFRYLGSKNNDLDEVQKNIRRKVLMSGRFYIVQTSLQDSHWLRCTIINPNTTLNDLQYLLDFIRGIE